MTIEIYPTAIEAYEYADGIFKLEALDECAAKLTISTAVNPTNWPEVSEAIGKSLAMMFPPGRAE
jgi:hypothetical protein